ncbi:HDR054Wp [Eremothecium sinecaudum]|uniref:HDR054Wp n=1 Tax=Eremothecium sinecaudum TaxID=45286 RepID=A0A0X8HSS9_9SACH|nr:HDR054Wp [Eremothecium sinecaudum]AMD20796.1 HDR054Wp [Eremothecium sinecaudum]
MHRGLLQKRTLQPVRYHSRLASHNSQFNKPTILYGFYLTLGFTVPFLLSYYETYHQTTEELSVLKSKLNPRCVFARWI